MKRIKIKTSRNYEVIVGAGASTTIGAEISAISSAARILTVTDDNVAPLHADAFISRLPQAAEKHIFILPHGEEHKSIETVMSILTYLKEHGFDRNDLIIALGGGVTGDMAAFAASIYMRGIDFVNVPTTLLSQVDSSVGGKTGVDFLGAKNIIGTFYQPRLVLCDTDYLNTLPDEIFADGCAEVIKYAFINDPRLLELIDGGIKSNIESIVFRCVSNKNDIVSRDEFDRGDRALLNFGHTIGHAVEGLSEYKISHGKAVAIGMAVISEACEASGICVGGVYDRLVSVLTANSLPASTDFTAEALIGAVKNDKKKSGDGISVIVPVSIAQTQIKKMSFDELYELIKGVLL